MLKTTSCLLLVLGVVLGSESSFSLDDSLVGVGAGTAVDSYADEKCGVKRCVAGLQLASQNHMNDITRSTHGADHMLLPQDLQRTVIQLQGQEPSHVYDDGPGSGIMSTSDKRTQQPTSSEYFESESAVLQKRSSWNPRTVHLSPPQSLRPRKLVRRRPTHPRAFLNSINNIDDNGNNNGGDDKHPLHSELSFKDWHKDSSKSSSSSDSFHTSYSHSLQSVRSESSDHNTLQSTRSSHTLDSLPESLGERFSHHEDRKDANQFPHIQSPFEKTLNIKKHHHVKFDKSVERLRHSSQVHPETKQSRQFSTNGSLRHRKSDQTNGHEGDQTNGRRNSQKLEDEIAPVASPENGRHEAHKNDHNGKTKPSYLGPTRNGQRADGHHRKHHELTAKERNLMRAVQLGVPGAILAGGGFGVGWVAGHPNPHPEVPSPLRFVPPAHDKRPDGPPADGNKGNGQQGNDNSQ